MSAFHSLLRQMMQERLNGALASLTFYFVNTATSMVLKHTNWR